MGRKWSAQAAQEFLGCAGAVPARQDDLEVAPAKMSLNKGKSAAPGVGGCNAMKGLTIMSCPAQTEKNAQDCLKITRRHFSWGQQEVGIRLYRHRASRNSLKRGFSHLAMLDSVQSFCGLRHKHCRSRVMARGCVNYRMTGTEERTAISVSNRLQSTIEHKVLRQIFVSTVTWAGPCANQRKFASHVLPTSTFAAISCHGITPLVIMMTVTADTHELLIPKFFKACILLQCM